MRGDDVAGCIFSSLGHPYPVVHDSESVYYAALPMLLLLLMLKLNDDDDDATG